MYQRLGLAALLVSAMRSAVADPEVQAQVDAQGAQISAVRSGFDSLTSRLEAIESSVGENGKLDEGQAEELAGIKAELRDMADALTGPADDNTDNGVIAEVAPVEVAPASDTATVILEESPVEIPPAVETVEAAPEAE